MSSLRHALKHTRATIPLSKRLEYAAKVYDLLIKQDYWKNAARVALYSPFQAEMPTELLAKELWQRKKHVYLPVLQPDETLQFQLYQENSILTKNQFGILEPQTGGIISLTELDLVITPLVGFDAACHRLGSGKGYYDRSFAFLNCSIRPPQPLLIGIAYEQQRVEHIDAQPWDVSLDAVITQERIYKFKKTTR